MHLDGIKTTKHVPFSYENYSTAHKALSLFVRKKCELSFIRHFIEKKAKEREQYEIQGYRKPITPDYTTLSAYIISFAFHFGFTLGTFDLSVLRYIRANSLILMNILQRMVARKLDDCKQTVVKDKDCL